MTRKIRATARHPVSGGCAARRPRRTTRSFDRLGVADARARRGSQRHSLCLKGYSFDQLFKDLVTPWHAFRPAEREREKVGRPGKEAREAKKASNVAKEAQGMEPHVKAEAKAQDGGEKGRSGRGDGMPTVQHACKREEGGSGVEVGGSRQRNETREATNGVKEEEDMNNAMKTACAEFAAKEERGADASVDMARKLCACNSGKLFEDCHGPTAARRKKTLASVTGVKTESSHGKEETRKMSDGLHRASKRDTATDTATEDSQRERGAEDARQEVARGAGGVRDKSMNGGSTEKKGDRKVEAHVLAGADSVSNVEAAAKAQKKESGGGGGRLGSDRAATQRVVDLDSKVLDGLVKQTAKTLIYREEKGEASKERAGETDRLGKRKGSADDEGGSQNSKSKVLRSDSDSGEDGKARIMESKTSHSKSSHSKHATKRQDRVSNGGDTDLTEALHHWRESRGHDKERESSKSKKSSREPYREEALHHTVEIYWPYEKEWFRGVVDKYKPQNGMRTGVVERARQELVIERRRARTLVLARKSRE